MSENIKYTLILMLLSLSLNQALAQADTIITTKATPDSIDVKYDRIYKLFVEETGHEIKHLFKLDLANINLLTPALTFERKLGRNFSFETEVFLSYKTLSYDEEDSALYYPTSEFAGSDLQCFSVGGYQMIKFYHNLNRRERLGKNINGFSGNYFGIKLSADYSWISELGQENEEQPKPEDKYYIVPGIVYGIQRRIGNIGYAELSYTLNYYPEHIRNSDYSWQLGLESGLTLKLGFAIESVSRLKSTLKK